MCGIAGIVGAAAEQQVASVRTMMNMLKRRGPDDEGLYAWPNAAFGHRRLSIFDLSAAGRQPMLSPSGAVGIVFNGAIYNFRNLREQLQREGMPFETQTDTEVLVRGYTCWGIDGLVERLHGMFAFALWDDDRQTLYLVRDRLGVKPLLYASRDGLLAFASSASALRAAGFAETIDERAVAEFLEYGFVTEERCIYHGVHKLAPAHILQWSQGRIAVRRYWEAPQPQNGRVDFQEAVDETERLFLEAVKMRLAADVPVGALLSGGIDSSLVCWAIGKLGGDVTAFTASTPGDEWDETADAQRTAMELGVRHRVLVADPEHSPTVKDLTSAYGEPFASASALGMLALSREVKEHATVLLTGDGGDDAFLGYPRHLHYAQAQRFARRTPAIAGPFWRAMRPIVPKTGILRRAAHFVDYCTGGLGAVASAHDGLPDYERFGLLQNGFSHASVDVRRMPWSVGNGRRVLSDFIDYERRTRFVAEYLTKVDGATMYHGLEARSPFLDQSLWTFAARLPHAVHLHGGTLKAILREIARKRISPRVAAGPKRGFGIPAQRWMTAKWRPQVEETFEYSILEREGWIDAAAVRRLLASLDPGETAPAQLWRLFVLERWMKDWSFSVSFQPRTRI